MKSLRKITLATFVTALVLGFSIFAFQNSAPVSVEIFTYTTPAVPRFIVLFVVFFMGVLVAGLFSMMELIFLSSKSRKLKRQIETLEKQLVAMKNQPLMDDFSGPGAKKKSTDDPAESEPIIKGPEA